MAQLQIQIDNFVMNSRWTGYRIYTDLYNYDTEYSSPSTVTVEKEFDLSALPEGAVITAATLTAGLGSPYTGAAFKRVDDVSFNGTLDVLAKLQALDGDYSNDLDLVFTFKANGGAGGTSVTGTQITSTLSITACTLTITYTPPGSTGSLDKTTVDAGQNIAIQNITPPDLACTHKAVWSMGGQTVTHDLAAGVTSDSLTVPTAWLDTIPSDDSGIAQCELITYMGETPMGSNVYPFTVRVPASALPTVSIVVEPYSDTSPAVPSAWGFVQGRSKAKITATASGIYGSTIAEYAFSGEGFTGSSNPFTTGLLPSAGQKSFVCAVKDSRGRTKISTVAVIDVMAYAPPSISLTQIGRCLSDKTPSDSGTYIRVRTTLAISSLGGHNDIVKRRVYYRKTGDAAWLPEGGVDLASMTPDMAIGGGNIATTDTYQVMIELADALTPDDNPARYIGYINTEACIADLRPDRAAFGRRATYAKQLTIPDDWEIPYKGQPLDARFLKILDYTAQNVLNKVKEVDGDGSGLDADTLRGNAPSAFQEALTAGSCITLLGGNLSAKGLYEFATSTNGWRIKLGDSTGGIMIQAKRINVTTGQFTTWNDRVYYKDIDFGAWDAAFAALWDVLPGVSDNVQFWPTNSVAVIDNALSATATNAGTWRLESGTSPSKTGNVTVIGIGTY